MAINLLPSDKVVNTSTQELTQKLNRAVAVLSIILVIVIAGSLGGYIYLGSQANELTNQQISLSNSIESLESTEQKIILLKNRVDVAREIYSAPSAHAQMPLIENLVSLMPPGGTVKESVLKANTVEIKVNLLSANDVTNFIADVITSQSYSNVSLSNLVYSQAAGYELSFVFTL